MNLIKININTNLRAVSEYPRCKGCAYDMSILKDEEIIHKIEFKYQYPKDLENPQVKGSILKDVNESKCEEDCTDFILIIHEKLKGYEDFNKSGVEPIFNEMNDTFSGTDKRLLNLEVSFLRKYTRDYLIIDSNFRGLTPFDYFI